MAIQKTWVKEFLVCERRNSNKYHRKSVPNRIITTFQTVSHPSANVFPPFFSVFENPASYHLGCRCPRASIKRQQKFQHHHHHRWIILLWTGPSNMHSLKNMFEPRPWMMCWDSLMAFCLGTKQIKLWHLVESSWSVTPTSSVQRLELHKGHGIHRDDCTGMKLLNVIIRKAAKNLPLWRGLTGTSKMKTIENVPSKIQNQFKISLT